MPCCLFVAYIIELAAANQARGAIGRAKRQSENPQYSIQHTKSFSSTWLIIAWAHGINATLSLLVTSVVVYQHIYHPLIGTISEVRKYFLILKSPTSLAGSNHPDQCRLRLFYFQRLVPQSGIILRKRKSDSSIMVDAIIVWLKICSYAFTNRDLRMALLTPNATASIPDLYSACPYPRNIALSNLCYFWWAPTLVYQPVYPRSSEIRWFFISKRLAEAASLSIFIWLASAQYAAPLLHNSLSRIATLDVPSILERLMKLSTISLIIWLAGFFAIFQSLLNALAEVMRFGTAQA